MVLGFVGNILGGLFGGSRSSAASSFAASEAGLARQFQYDQKLAEQQYGYTSMLNRQTYDYSTALTRQQYNLERESRQSSFQDTRKDLESAGYNPLLALGQQSGYVNVGQSMSGNSFNMPDSSSVFSAIGAATNYAQTKSNIESSKYTNDLNLALTEKARSEARGQDINNIIEDSYGLIRAQQEIDNMKKQGLLSEAQSKYYKKQLAVANSQIALNSANAQVLRSQNALNDQAYDLQEPSRRFAKKHPVVHGTLNRVNPVSALGSLAV